MLDFKNFTTVTECDKQATVVNLLLTALDDGGRDPDPVLSAVVHDHHLLITLNVQLEKRQGEAASRGFFCIS